MAVPARAGTAEGDIGSCAPPCSPPAGPRHRGPHWGTRGVRDTGGGGGRDGERRAARGTDRAQWPPRGWRPPQPDRRALKLPAPCLERRAACPVPGKGCPRASVMPAGSFQRRAGSLSPTSPYPQPPAAPRTHRGHGSPATDPRHSAEPPSVPATLPVPGATSSQRRRPAEPAPAPAGPRGWASSSGEGPRRAGVWGALPGPPSLCPVWPGRPWLPRGVQSRLTTERGSFGRFQPSGQL